MLKNNWLKQNKMLVIAAIITLTTGATVYAESSFVTTNNNNNDKVGMMETTVAKTDTETDRKSAEMSEKWGKLSDEQREAIYNLEEEKGGIEQKIIDKYQEYGLITEEDAAEMKENNSERLAMQREHDILFPLEKGMNMKMSYGISESKDVEDVSGSVAQK